MADFIHLHNHTDYSILDGAGRIKDYIKKCKEYGMNAMAITDHGNMFGAVDFYNQCKKAGIKPIVGCEFYLCPLGLEIKDDTNRKRYHLILLAKNEEGYRNLLKLTSTAYVKGFYQKPRIDKKNLEMHSNGIVCLSACIAGEIPQLILDDKMDEAIKAAKWYEKTFGHENFFIEIQRHGLEDEKKLNPALIELAHKMNLPLVATNDCHYVNADDAEAQDILMCIGMGKKLNDEGRFKFDGVSYYMKTPDEMTTLFSDIPEAIENTKNVSDLCNLEINFPGPILPAYKVPDGFKGEADYLTFIANEGLKKRYGENMPTEYQERLNYELSVIINMHFDGYYLIVYDYVHWSKEHGVPVGPGRGSGAGSIVAYSIGITDIDPMKYGLLFERFLNPERISMPDFDIDFCTDKREKAIEYVTNKYGSDNVGQICTFGTLKVKNCIKDVSRVLDIPLSEVNAMIKVIIDDIDLEFDWLINGHTRDDGSIYAKNEDFLAYKNKDEKFRKLFEIIPKLEGMARNLSLHAAGVVIGRERLDTYVPLYYDPKSGAVATEYTMKQIEDCGLVKMDFLGLKTLTLIQHAVDFVRKKEKNFDISKISEEDEATFNMLSLGDAQGVFQFESAGMRATLKKAKPKSISDLAALNALYRPGPMDNIPQFIEGKENPEKIKYPHPSLKHLLEETYGVIVYQEQVMKVAQEFAGYSLGEADILRKIMGKKQKDKLPAAREKFIKCSCEKEKTKQEAEHIFDLLEPFAGYGFNKSHAVGYAFLAYQTAYLKANYPVEFMAANLIMESQGSDTDKFNAYLSLTREMGIEITPPDVNKSEVTFSVKDSKIVYGLSGIKNVGVECVKAIIKERESNGPYKDFIDFVIRTKDKGLNSRSIQSLNWGGAFDSFGMTRANIDYNIEKALKYAAKNKDPEPSSLFGDDEAVLAYQYAVLPPEREWKKMEKLKNEFAVLGIYISGHPLDKYSAFIKRTVKYPLEKLSEKKNGKYTIIGILDKVTELSTKTGKLMGRVLISDYTASSEALIWSREWEEMKPNLAEGEIYQFEIEKKDDEGTLIIKNCIHSSAFDSQSALDCKIYLNDNLNKESLSELKKYLSLQHGTVAVSFVLSQNGREEEMETRFTLEDNNEIYDRLKDFQCVKVCKVM